MRRRSQRAFLMVAALCTACIFRSSSAELMSPSAATGVAIRTPLKAFHLDGTITVFAQGARVTSTAVEGAGQHYSMDLTTAVDVQRVQLDDLVGIEAFREGVRALPTFLGSTAGVFGSLALFKALFGSCPTIYSYSDGVEMLEAEAFSYSIAPLLEARDVDRLQVRPERDGTVRLEVRNEALETHYINHLELLEARHPTGTRAYPNESGRVVWVGPEAAPLEVHDRDGALHTAALRSRDGLSFASAESRIRAATSEDYWEHVELVFPKPAAESAALVLRLRNSLLNTVLFYDLMLASRGAEALQWLGSDIHRISEAVELGRWFQETMGMRISVLRDGAWREVARLGDSGPIAWEEVAVPIPLSDANEVRVRLTFLVDEWRIDYAALGAGVERATVTPLAVSEIGWIDAAPDAELRRQLAEPDDDYLITTAGSALSLEFEPTTDRVGGERTFFLSSQGYYAEWIRPDWIETSVASESSPRFTPSAEVIEDLMARWLAQKDDYEKRFHDTRIPVR